MKRFIFDFFIVKMGLCTSQEETNRQLANRERIHRLNEYFPIPNKEYTLSKDLEIVAQVWIIVLFTCIICKKKKTSQWNIQRLVLSTKHP